MSAITSLATSWAGHTFAEVEAFAKNKGIPYAVCVTAGATAAKTVSISGFSLVETATVAVLFSYGFTSSNPTLNVSSTGAKAIYYRGAAIDPFMVMANTILTLQYNGTNWNVIAYDAHSIVDEFVDLALPSGLKWCKHNVGANNPEDYGKYFQWGNVDGVEGYGASLPSYSTPIEGNISAGSKYDAARANMGAPWRMPTQEEFDELYNNCNLAWTSLNGVYGKRFTSKNNGNSVFFPAAGYLDGSSFNGVGNYGKYWTASYAYGNNVCITYFDYGTFISGQTSNGKYGAPVRAVQ